MLCFTEIFASTLFGKHVVDCEGQRVGRLRDLIVQLGDVFPQVTKIMVTLPDRQTAFYGWSCVEGTDDKRLYLNCRLDQLQELGFDPQRELRLHTGLIDKQIVDLNGCKVVRVNDLKLVRLNDVMRVVAADVGMRGILRRLGIERLAAGVASLLGQKIPDKLIPGECIASLQPQAPHLRLTIPQNQLSHMHPADLAAILSELDVHERTDFFETLDDEMAADALGELEPALQVSIINNLDNERAADVLEEMEPDEAADLLADLPQDRTRELINLMEKEEAEDVQELMRYQEDSAGGLMTTEYITMPATLTAQQTIDRLRQQAPDTEMIYYVYVVDEENRLQGVLSLRGLIVAPPDTSLAEIMNPRTISIPLSADREEIGRLMAKYKLLALPVVDEENRLHGVVTIDDAVWAEAA